MDDKFRHTQGNWYVATDGHDILVDQEGGGRMLIATVLCTNYKMTDEYFQETCANAFLMAASDNLLQACISAFRHIVNNDRTPTEVTAELTNAINKAGYNISIVDSE